MTNTHSLSNPFSLTNQSKTKTLLIFGTCCTGKTTLLLQLTKNRFDDEYQTTIGVNYYFKELSLVTFSIWDTRGTEISENFLPKHLFTSAHCFIIVLSYSDIESLNEAISYIDFIKSQTNCDYQRTSLNNNKPIIALINKKDVKDKQFKRIEAVVALRDVCPNILIGEITAKDNLMVKNFFEKVESLLVFGRINNNRGEEFSVYTLFAATYYSDAIISEGYNYRIWCSSCSSITQNNISNKKWRYMESNYIRRF